MFLRAQRRRAATCSSTLQCSHMYIIIIIITTIITIIITIIIQSVQQQLTSGLLHLTETLWSAALARVASLQPPHVSVYDLQVEPGTRFGRRLTPGEAPLPSDEAGAAMYRAASEQLRVAGYEHYEISNYALPGRRSVHNQVYWASRSCYGFGLGAASFVEVGCPFL